MPGSPPGRAGLVEVHSAGTAIAAVVIVLPTARLQERMAAGLVESLAGASSAVEACLADDAG
ncbi:hypothetical protein LWC35_03455 [Pseudonocardia kujensis]|uniref:hypothetical protein n=1 Tax=Pseudonocardia kujensis TaxID=1128675 RepID=UPI001E3605FB|nr:hypothetical protein [Pseudonocardia kujensis]MCE0761974.1 hypothetical protein [Pseudonocardia kujensis]